MDKMVASLRDVPSLAASSDQAGRSKAFRAMWLKIASRVLPPALVFVLFIGAWEWMLRLLDVKAYLLPKPSDIMEAAVQNSASLAASVSTTVLEAVIGFAVSVVLGVAVAILLALSKMVERSVYPYAIILQTIPIVAVAPIIVIWFGAGMNAIVVIAFLISFFPILSNTLIGLNATEQNMKNLFHLYNATKMQTIWRLRIPSALPYILAGLKISCSLSVVGAIVGEYIAGIGGMQGGLGYAITVASSQLKTPYLFACGLSAALVGIVFFLIINALSNRLLRSWHDSAMNS